MADQPGVLAVYSIRRRLLEERAGRVTGQHTPQMNAESAQRRVLASYVTHYNRVRPHQGLDQQTPVPSVLHDHAGPVRRRDVLGGLIHEYDRAAA